MSEAVQSEEILGEKLEELYKRPEINSAMVGMKDLVMQRIESLLAVDEQGQPTHVKMKGTETLEDTFEVLRVESKAYIERLRADYPNMFAVGEYLVEPVVQFNLESKAIDVNVFLRTNVKVEAPKSESEAE